MTNGKTVTAIGKGICDQSGATSSPKSSEYKPLTESPLRIYRHDSQRVTYETERHANMDKIYEIEQYTTSIPWFRATKLQDQCDFCLKAISRATLLVMDSHS